MKFKNLRDIICDTCIVIKGNENESVATHQVTKFDDCEVIGIRSRTQGIGMSYVEVIVK